MKLTSPSVVRALLTELDITPSKSLGQNFLIDENIREIILKTAAVGPQDSVLEIGAGLGALTESLVGRARHVTAVEIDRRFCRQLANRFGDKSDFTLVCEDVLARGCTHLLDDGPEKVVANLPYSVAGRVLVALARAVVPPKAIVVTVQFEVARRLCALSGNKDYGLLSVWTQLVYAVSMAKVVNPTCFWPKPRVRSAVVKMVLTDRRRLAGETLSVFYVLTEYAFAHRRKQIGTILRSLPGRLARSAPEGEALLDAVGLDARARPSDLCVDDWRRLAKTLATNSGG